MGVTPTNLSYDGLENLASCFKDPNPLAELYSPVSTNPVANVSQPFSAPGSAVPNPAGLSSAKPNGTWFGKDLPTYGTATDGSTWAVHKTADGNGYEWKLANPTEIAASLGVRKGTPWSDLINDQAFMDAVGKSGYSMDKLQKIIDLKGSFADVDAKIAETEYFRASTENLETQKWFGLGNAIMQLGKDVVTSILAFQQMAMQGRMADIAENKEAHQYALQDKLLDYQKDAGDNAAKYDLQKEKVQANVEIQKAKYAADVKKTSIQTKSLDDLFHRNNYYYGIS